MNVLNISRQKLVVSLWVAFIASVPLSTVANDLVPAGAQSDEQISVWVDDASLSVFVSQLARITGRQVDVDKEIEGRISGRFNGSMAEALSSVTDQFPVLIDISDTSLRVSSEDQRYEATVPIEVASVSETLQGELLAGLLPGNNIQFNADSVVIDGHPAFVERTVRSLTSTVVEPSLGIVSEASDDQVPDSTSEQLSENVVNQLVVVDSAATVMVEETVLDESDGADTSASVEASTDRPVGPKTIDWVTDIPGFETF